MKYENREPKPANAQCKECTIDQDYPTEIMAEGVLCGGCGRTRPPVKYVLPSPEPEEWVSVETGCEMPDYDVPVLWLTEDGNMRVESLDKDGNPWLFGEDKSEWGDHPKATHWRELPKPPIK